MSERLKKIQLFGNWATEHFKGRAYRGFDLDKRLYGILCAMEEEVQPIVKEMSNCKIRHIASMTFYIGTLKGKKVVVVKCGIGKVNAAICAQTLCLRFHVDALIHVGVAGSPYPQIEQKDIVISTQTVQHDFDLTPLGYAPGENSDFNMVYFPASQELVHLAHAAAEAVVPENVFIYEGTIASGDQFIADPVKAKEILRHFSAMAVEMEGAAVGQVAYVYDVPYVVVRGISDNANHDAKLSFQEYVKVASKISADVVCKMMELA